MASAGFATPVSAQTETESRQGILADGVAEGGDNWAFFSGMMSSAFGTIGRREDPERLAGAMQNEFNANADAWVSYGNWLTDEYDVQPIGAANINVTVAQTRRVLPDPFEPYETHIEVGYDDETETFDHLEWHDGEVDDADYHLEIRNQAAESAPDELLEFRQTFIGEDGEGHELPDQEYISELQGKYFNYLRFGEDAEHVLQLLLGN
ncbi:hypothetical protein NGM15_18480 (plasmid) [Natronosalvus halobius]|nr:hypothetical protein NGM15_18480 [Natronosalvus halobius]